MQTQTSGEVDILGTVLLRVYYGTTFQFCIEIGLYLTDKEQKISWHSFFLTHGVDTFMKKYESKRTRSEI